MIDLSVNHLQKFFGSFQLLKDVSFDLYSGERVGLIGKNGAGKSTLFNILSAIGTGRARPGDPSVYDAGEVAFRGEVRVGLIDQLPNFPPEFTVEDVLRTGFYRLDALKDEIAALERQMQDSADDNLLRRYGTLTQRFENEGGYETDYMLEKVANGLDLGGDILHRPFEQLSGGERSRANLARVILERSDLLLLDEPTNHLDIDAVEWLGEYLASYKGTVLVISHDRYFLDEVVTRIIELEDGVTDDYDGNYSYYAVEKERRFAERMERYEREMAQKKKLEALVRQYRSWATETMMTRAKEIEHRVERLTVSDRPRRQRAIYGRLDEATFYADDALSVREVTKRFDGKTIVDKAAFHLGGGEHAAIYGPNGCGKTTLLRMIVGEYPCDEGSVRFGPQIKWIYLPQMVTFPNMERNVLDTLLYERKMEPQEARDALAQYLFVGDDVFKPLTALSGGERARLRLCMEMQDDVNMLILDEPTNHLDLAAREWLEGMLEGFGGVILFVSHDRYFVSRFATRIFDMTDGHLKDYKCGFEEYRTRVRRERESALAQARLKKAAEERLVTAAAVSREDAKAARRRERGRDKAQNRAQALEKRLEELALLQEQNATDYERLSQLLEEQTQVEEELLGLYEELEN